MTRILGISAYYHDSPAAIAVNGRVISAAQEESSKLGGSTSSNMFEQAHTMFANQYRLKRFPFLIFRTVLLG
jgi:predicted NodU family carbamoyl transferase